MKWTIQELKKLFRTNNQFQSFCDCKKFLSEDDPDILDMSEVFVKGDFQILSREGLFLFNCEISCELVMPCAITLEEVKVPIRFQTTLEFAQTFVDDNTHIFEGITIDLDLVIYSEILIEKPLRVLSENAYENYAEEHSEIEEGIQSSNPFAKYKK